MRSQASAMATPEAGERGASRRTRGGPSPANFRPAPFHAGKFPLKGGLTTGRPQAGGNGSENKCRTTASSAKSTRKCARTRRRPCGTAMARPRIALAVLVVLGDRRLTSPTTTGSRASANRSGDAFSQALTLANDGKNDEALAALRGAREGRLRRLSAAGPHARGDRARRQGRLRRRRRRLRRGRGRHLDSRRRSATWRGCAPP